MRCTSDWSRAVANAGRRIVHTGAAGAGLALLLLGLAAGPAAAQGVPQYGTFRGRLLDLTGVPQTGPVNLELWLFDAETAGSVVYKELHTGVTLDVTGGFAVQFGLGTPLMAPPAGGAAGMFASVPRWLEVKQGSQVLSPRVRIGSAPWALVAQQASKIVPDPTAPRFEDCGDGTVADHKTDLRWEKKTGTPGDPVWCGPSDCPDPHDVRNVYFYSSTGTLPDGSAFENFLARLNGESPPIGNDVGCFVARCDWRLPKLSELLTIMIGPDSAPGQPQVCSAAPCIDPAFAAVAGPSAASMDYMTGYVSESTVFGAASPIFVWVAYMQYGTVNADYKTFSFAIRAVRSGACD